jgi:phosphatidylinositol alpha 1,6-mannosyltransferase
VVEAMASGVPVVTVNSGGVTEYLVNGVNAHLTSPNNVAELAQQLESTLCSDDNQAMIDNALETTQQLSLEKGCVRLNQYYQQLLALKSSTYERHVMEAVSVETIHTKPLC